jgi:hypothetical protein
MEKFAADSAQRPALKLQASDSAADGRAVDVVSEYSAREMETVDDGLASAALVVTRWVGGKSIERHMIRLFSSTQGNCGTAVL